MTSTGAQDRDSRRAAHTQRRTALREARERGQRPARVGVAAGISDPFAAVQTYSDFELAERAFG